jgi:hypothetical protein
MERSPRSHRMEKKQKQGADLTPRALSLGRFHFQLPVDHTERSSFQDIKELYPSVYLKMPAHFES